MQEGARKLRVYSDRSYLPQRVGHVPMLVPFWGARYESGEYAREQRFATYAEVGHNYLDLTEDPGQADFAVLPAAWNEYERAGKQSLGKAFARRMRRAGKRLLVFIDSDEYDPLPFPDAVEFRTSLLRSRRRSCEFAAPAWNVDFVTMYCAGKLQPRSKAETPVIGFCGVPEPEVRREALDHLTSYPAVRTNFLLRTAFYGGSITWTKVAGMTAPVWNEPLGRVVRDQFLNNMLASDYVLSVRGRGNFSHRFYETLICGRIPVFVDTDCLLPYHDLIDWRRYCVWCDQSELSQIGPMISEFHSRLSPEEFMELQRACRRLWEDRLSPQGFFAHFHEHFL